MPLITTMRSLCCVPTPSSHDSACCSRSAATLAARLSTACFFVTTLSPLNSNCARVTDSLFLHMRVREESQGVHRGAQPTRASRRRP